VAKKVLAEDEPLIHSLPLETNYLGTVVDGVLDFYEGNLRHRRFDGSFSEFPEENWAEYLKEKALPESYGKSVCFKDEDKPFRVGPLARLNCADRMGTPLADAELEEFRSLYGNPCHQTVMYHHARMIELIYCFEKLEQIIKDDELFGDTIRAKVGTPRNGCAHVEAPRGVLIHDYEVDQNAIVTRANLLVATQQNITSINDTIALSARKYLDQPDVDLMNSIEFGIRCYDPCLSCATHRVGEMKLIVEIRQNGNTIRSMRR
jgi:F420-non-reducing hydrogenase large subunit